MISEGEVHAATNAQYRPTSFASPVAVAPVSLAVQGGAHSAVHPSFEGSAGIEGAPALLRTTWRWVFPRNACCAATPRQRFPLPLCAPQDMEDSAIAQTSARIYEIFLYYCSYGRTSGRGATAHTLDSFNFAKFARDCPGLIDGELVTTTDVDIAFAKSKGPRGRCEAT